MTRRSAKVRRRSAICGGSCGRLRVADRAVARELAVGLFRERLHLVRRDVAGDDQHRVVGLVEALVEVERIGAVERFHLVAPADGRLVVGMVEILRGAHLLGEARGRLVLDALVALFEDDVALAHDDVVGEHEAGHAVGLEFHQGAEMLARGALEIAGVVVRRERVLLAADRGELLREAPGRILRGALEHQMLEEMRDAGLARRLVGGADAVPQHVGDDRRAVIRDHHHGHAVGERELRDRGRGGGVAGAGHASGDAQAKDQEGANQHGRHGFLMACA